MSLFCVCLFVSTLFLCALRLLIFFFGMGSMRQLDSMGPLPSQKTFLTAAFLWQTSNSHGFDVHFNKSFVLEGNGNILVQKNFCKEVLDFVNFREIYPLRRVESSFLNIGIFASFSV